MITSRKKKKNIPKKTMTKRKKTKHGNLNVNQKEQLRKYEKF